MKPKSHIFGKAAESLATAYLRKKGYRILHRNMRLAGGELDLIVQDRQTLVFVEVKARRSKSHGGAPYTLTSSKKLRLIKLAAQYLAQRQISQRACRFDVVLCHGDLGQPLELIHIEDAFEIPGEDIRW
ncbi:MAG: YraN family protein [Nitrospirales bacterium]|nr:YraN family protein [Nitrospira sp.]MDR4501674.1 YraN family protein [Nitrospirales bacterium]